MRTQNLCVDCGEEISARRRRCPSCKKANHARLMRERRAAEPGYGYRMHDDAVGPVVDLMQQGSRPPSYPGVAYRDGAPDDTVIDYSVADAGPRHGQPRTPDLSRLPARDRHDLVRAQRLAQQLADEDQEADVTSWDALNAQQEGHTVNVTGPSSLRSERPQYAISNPAAAGTLYGQGPAYNAAAAGQAVRRHVPQQNRGPQQTPHILN